MSCHYRVVKHPLYETCMMLIADDFSKVVGAPIIQGNIETIRSELQAMLRACDKPMIVSASKKGWKEADHA